MKIKFLKCAVLSAIILASANSAANAYDFNEKVYGKVQFNFGYSLQGYSGDIKDHINEVEAMNNLAYSFGGPKIKTNKHNQAVTFGIGYNIYSKVHKLFHPFIGLEAQGRIPFAGSEVFEGTKVLDVFRFNAKFGAKFNPSQSFSVQPYALLGMNIMQIKSAGNNEIQPGATAGIGVEAIINNIVVFGIEYRYGYNKFNNFVAQTNNLGLNLGIQLF